MAPDAGSLGAILLAAGGSKRLGQAKQLLDIDGEPLVARQARILLELNPAAVAVVTGAAREKVEPLLGDLPVRTVYNPDWERGMGASLACAIGAMPERARAALVLLCDQWRVTAEDLSRLVGTWVDNPGAAVVSAYDETTGSPAILPRAMFERLSRLRGDTGAKRILRNWKGEMIRVAMPSAAPDIDTPGHLPGTSAVTGCND